MRQRTKAFASMIVRFYCGLDMTRDELRVLGKQLLRAGASVAANFREASRSRSSAEFIAKIELCAQEADEAELWLELLRDDCGISPALTDSIWKEADELISILPPWRRIPKTTKSRISTAITFPSSLNFQVSS